MDFEGVPSPPRADDKQPDDLQLRAAEKTMTRAKRARGSAREWANYRGRRKGLCLRLLFEFDAGDDRHTDPSGCSRH